ncbi:DNA integrity scanning diadenylate cyclase DisA [Proteinivorax hydrogeniformans]|uniref:DNA integrity scanning protein DisA n=1 Tax=Proteinivorax hydrogeniformans TaxID=1826727 RepID=A0AAU8HTE8_9FIRM
MQALRTPDDNFLKTLELVAPGTKLREGLENVLRAKTGALIVIGESPQLQEIVSGGFFINSDFSPANLYELAKMDGAILLSYDSKKILYANTQLIPDSKILSTETGIRHRTAERVARQTGELVISISQRRNTITLYKGYVKYALKDISVILNKANQAIQTLDKYRSVLEQSLVNLSALEFEEMVNVVDVANVLQRYEMVLRIVSELGKYIVELGDEGRLIKMQLEELISNVKEEGYLVIKDYMTNKDIVDPDETLKNMSQLSSEELLELTSISKVLGYGVSVGALDQPVKSKGHRILNKIPRLPMPVIENAVNSLGGLQNILLASIEELDDVEGIGEVRARAIKDGLRRLQQQVLLDRHV